MSDSSANSSPISSPIKTRRCSSTASSESSLRDLETEYLALRDEHLSYEDDAEFHIFIDALDRVDTLVTEHTPKAERRKSFGRILTLRTEAYRSLDLAEKATTLQLSQQSIPHITACGKRFTLFLNDVNGPRKSRWEADDSHDEIVVLQWLQPRIRCSTTTNQLHSGRFWTGDKEDRMAKKETYNTGHSPVVTDPTTTPAVASLTMGERTGSRIL
ncbi:hypothetical protein MRS44_005864 [Fusarium solani]|uniref:uncharacterized protein n=1 Tax=Fusarium solani TaxID=169388 RepID=UPI0032C49163|nr:hypothetical protein MRS44_005864 [Fusarium solani]